MISNSTMREVIWILTDRERKLLRILYVGRKIPNMEYLETKTGDCRGDILNALPNLEKQGYIVWPDRQLSVIKVIEGWERKQISDLVRSTPKPNNLDYWTR